MAIYPGVAIAYRKDGTAYYRASITVRRKHISLGSFLLAEDAYHAYLDANTLLENCSITIADFASFSLSYDKFIVLLNLRDNGIYFKTPIYLCANYFQYHLAPDTTLIFDRDDLFFYASHSIQCKGGYRFVCHYGSQYSILSRYGIRQFAVCDRDYLFVNGNCNDYRYDNIRVLNHYMGVTYKLLDGRKVYTTVIHIRGNSIVGRYSNEIEAAIAYNKAADTLQKLGVQKQYIRNYITGMSSSQYHELYSRLIISDSIGAID